MHRFSPQSRATTPFEFQQLFSACTVLKRAKIVNWRNSVFSDDGVDTPDSGSLDREIYRNRRLGRCWPQLRNSRSRARSKSCVRRLDMKGTLRTKGPLP